MSPSRRAFLAVLSSCGVGTLSGCSGILGTETESEPSAVRSDSPEPTATQSRWQQSAVLTPPEIATGGIFGHDVAAASDGQTVLVGSAPSPTSSGTTPVTVFERSDDEWRRQATLSEPDSDPLRFGSAVALADGGTMAFVGERADESLRVYCFERTGDSWDQTDRIEVETAETVLGLSLDVSADGTTLLVGPGTGQRRTTGSNRALVYEREGDRWRQQTELTPPSAVDHENFGTNVELSADGTTAVLDASTTSSESVPTEAQSAGSDRSAKHGGAYVYERVDGTWDRASRLFVPDDTGTSWLGERVALAGDAATALVGSPGSQEPPHAFERTNSGWEHSAVLPLSGVESDHQFSRSLALSADGRTALAGAAPGDDTESSDPGIAVRFRRMDDAWRRVATLSPWADPTTDRFGEAVELAADGTTGVVGAPTLEGVGNVYVFE